MVLLREISVFHLAVGTFLLALFRRRVLGGEIFLKRIDLLLELDERERHMPVIRLGVSGSQIAFRRS